MSGGTREVRCEGREVSACWGRVRENGVRRVECVGSEDSDCDSGGDCCCGGCWYEWEEEGGRRCEGKEGDGFVCLLVERMME